MKRPALSFLLVLWPEPLRPWIDWTLYGHDKERCLFFQSSVCFTGKLTA